MDAPIDALVTTEWLAAELEAPDLRVVDAGWFLPQHGRDAAVEYATGHIPGALFLDLETLADPDSDLPMTIPPAETLARRLGALGLGADTRIVFYDDSPLDTAARAWFVLRAFGVKSALLDGGLAKWRAEGRPLAAGDEPPRPAPPPALTPRPGAWRALADVRANLESGAELLVDARSAGRFTGTAAEPRPGLPSGHIPGSRNLPHADLFRPDGTWKRGEELRAAFEGAGVDLDRRLVMTCGSGVTAAALAFGAHLLGLDAALYDGSWTEWASDPLTPKSAGAVA